jgi:hypothetical protein
LLMIFHRVYGLDVLVNVPLPGVAITKDSKVGSLPVHVTLGKFPDEFLVFLPQWDDVAGCYKPEANFSSEAESDVPVLRVWHIHPHPKRSAHPGQVAVPDRQYFYFLYQDQTAFLVDGSGSEVWATWPDDLTLEDTTTYLLGSILGWVLRLRGVVCLHASAVVINGQVAVFLGAAGAGKSTTAAAFAQRGYPVLSDDVVALVDQGTTFWVQPAYPRIRLWNSSVAALYGSPEVLPRIVPTHPTWDKRYIDLTQPGYQFPQHSLSIAAVYVLHERSDAQNCPSIGPMPIQEQLITLVTNTHTNYLLDKQQRAQEFEVLSRLVKHVPVRQMTPHPDITHLPQLIDTVLEDFQSIVPARSFAAHA